MSPRRLPRSRYLSDAELARFMAAVRDRRHVHQPRDHALFALLANTGIRPSEALGMTRADVRLGAHPWIKLNRKPIPRRAAPNNEIPMHPEVGMVLARYCDAMDPADRLWPLGKRQIQRLFHYYGRRAGLPDHYRIYSLRHTCGIRLWRYTRDIRAIQAMLGHRWLMAAQSYIHTPPDEIRAVLTETLRG